jgi:hypothetical protein
VYTGAGDDSDDSDDHDFDNDNDYKDDDDDDHQVGNNNHDGDNDRNILDEVFENVLEGLVRQTMVAPVEAAWLLGRRAAADPTVMMVYEELEVRRRGREAGGSSAFGLGTFRSLARIRIPSPPLRCPTTLWRVPCSSWCSSLPRCDVTRRASLFPAPARPLPLTPFRFHLCSHLPSLLPAFLHVPHISGCCCYCCHRCTKGDVRSAETSIIRLAKYWDDYLSEQCLHLHHLMGDMRQNGLINNKQARVLNVSLLLLWWWLWLWLLLLLLWLWL